MSHLSEIDAETIGAAYSAPMTDGLYRRTFKRWLDTALILLSAPFVLPVILLLALLVRRDGGPAFYVQDRVGLDGRTFRLWKLRSMVVDADQRLAEHLAADPALRAEWDKAQKLKRDPRITAVGRLLRKTSLDELPQLWNVLKGDMSLVGPRPMMPEQRALYPGPGLLRHAPRPDRPLAGQRPQHHLLRRPRRVRRRLRPPHVARHRPRHPLAHGLGGAARHRLLSRAHAAQGPVRGR